MSKGWETNRTFRAKVERFINKANEKLEAVFKYSVQEIVADMTKTRGNGGAMPIDTGFLRASIMGSLSGMPQIDPNAKPLENAPKNSFAPQNEAVNAVIMNATLKDTIYIGFTASYARPQEYKNHFVGLAAQNWSNYVYEAAAEIAD